MSINQRNEECQIKTEVLSGDEYSTSVQITDENGRFLMTSYQVFPGIHFIYSDAHIQSVRFEERKTTSNDIIEISHCREGRLECNIHGEFCYLTPGDLCIARTNGVSSSLYFPLRHYHGLTIQIDLNKTPKGFSALFDEVGLEPKVIAERFCSEKESFISRANSSFEHIFSELYCAPAKAKKGYFQIKTLELLLLLSIMDTQQAEIDNRIYTKTQVDLAKKVSRYMLEHMNSRITLEQLVEHFHMSGAHIKRTFKGVFGVSIGTYIRVQKMESAAYMLEYTDKTILEIANEHGYDNSSKFASAFRAVKGSNPMKYRNAVSKKAT